MGLIFSMPPLKAGWDSVEKTDPELWARILARVKREPGPWAAWKAAKAIRMYKKAGGGYR